MIRFGDITHHQNIPTTPETKREGEISWRLEQGEKPLWKKTILQNLNLSDIRDNLLEIQRISREQAMEET